MLDKYVFENMIIKADVEVQYQPYDRCFYIVFASTLDEAEYIAGFSMNSDNQNMGVWRIENNSLRERTKVAERTLPFTSLGRNKRKQAYTLSLLIRGDKSKIALSEKGKKNVQMLDISLPKGIRGNIGIYSRRSDIIINNMSAKSLK